MKFKYTTIAVADMEESIKFYTEIIGLERYKQFNPHPGMTITFMKGEGESIIELIKIIENPQNPEKPRNPGLMAAGMEVEDMGATIKELKSKGAKITQEPMPISDGMILAFLEDPNGVRIALVQH